MPEIAFGVSLDVPGSAPYSEESVRFNPSRSFSDVMVAPGQPSLNAFRFNIILPIPLSFPYFS